MPDSIPVDTDGLVRLLGRLVACDTQNPPGREAPAAALLADVLRGFGMEAQVQPVGVDRANVVARLRRGDGPTIAFNSHLDTVPVGEGWTGDPLRLTERGGRLYGRGACDAKGSVAAMAEACRLLASTAGWHGTVVAAFVADEEIHSTGAKAVAAANPPFDAVIVGEPTGNQVLSAHRGCVRPLIRVHGRTAHSSRPDLGVNAIEAATRLVGAIAIYDAALSRRSHPLVGRTCVSVTRIQGGFADNVVPDRCDLVLDRRLLPSETTAEGLAELRDLLARARADDGIEAGIAAVRVEAGGCETSADAPVVRASLAAAARWGAPGSVGGLSGGCDLVHFHAAGSPGIILGPGSLDVAHQPDEHVPIDDLVRASLIYRDIALRLLAAP